MQKPIQLEAPAGVTILTTYALYRQALRGEMEGVTTVREEILLWEAELPRLKQKQQIRAAIQRRNSDLSQCLA